MRRADVEEQDQNLLRQQRQFRMAADVVTDALRAFAEVRSVAVIGSVAQKLWKEVPRFSEFRRERIEVWHECKDLDLAVWVDSQDGLGAMRRALAQSLNDAFQAGLGVSITAHQVDVFLFEPGSDRYLGRLATIISAQRASATVSFPAAARFPSTRSSTVSGHMPISSRRWLTPRSMSEARDGYARPSTCRRWRTDLTAPARRASSARWRPRPWRPTGGRSACRDGTGSSSESPGFRTAARVPALRRC